MGRTEAGRWKPAPSPLAKLRDCYVGAGLCEEEGGGARTIWWMERRLTPRGRAERERRSGTDLKASSSSSCQLSSSAAFSRSV